MRERLGPKISRIPPCSIGILMGNKNVENLLRKWLEQDATLTIYHSQDEVTLQEISKHAIFLVEDKVDDIDVHGIIELVRTLPNASPTQVIVLTPECIIYNAVQGVVYLVMPFNPLELRYFINQLLEH